MWASLRTRLWLTYIGLALSVLAILGLGLVLYLVRNPAIDRQTILRLETVAVGLERRLPKAGGGARQEALQRAAESFQVRFLLLSPEGRVLQDVHAGEGIPEIHPSARLLGKNSGMVRDAEGTPWLFVSRKLPSGGWFWVMTERPPRLSVLRTLLSDELLTLFGRAALAALALSFVMAYAISRWVVSPLQNIAQSAEALAQGETRPVPLSGPREVQVLGRAFNEMSRQVQSSRQAQRDFVANVSHDLKTPITSIQGFAQALLDGTADDPAVRRYAAQVIYDEAGRMHRLVLDLLELARFDAGTARLECAAVDMGALLRHLVHTMTPQAEEKTVRLELINRQETPQVQADADRLLRALTNLVDNAIRHTPEGGIVTLRLEPSSQGVVVRVEDTGPGIPESALPRLFE
ncbi:MAG: sensor histidine kinase, partial [Anaerolineae bacterium]